MLSLPEFLTRINGPKSLLFHEAQTPFRKRSHIALGLPPVRLTRLRHSARPTRPGTTITECYLLKVGESYSLNLAFETTELSRAARWIDTCYPACRQRSAQSTIQLLFTPEEFAYTNVPLRYSSTINHTLARQSSSDEGTFYDRFGHFEYINRNYALTPQIRLCFSPTVSHIQSALARELRLTRQENPEGDHLPGGALYADEHDDDVTDPDTLRCFLDSPVRRRRQPWYSRAVDPADERLVKHLLSRGHSILQKYMAAHRTPCDTATSSGRGFPDPLFPTPDPSSLRVRYLGSDIPYKHLPSARNTVYLHFLGPQTDGETNDMICLSPRCPRGGRKHSSAVEFRIPLGNSPLLELHRKTLDIFGVAFR